jgi:dihydrofolate reductase
MTNRVPNLSLVFAVDENNVLGKDNTIPWKSSHDFKWFKNLTVKSSTIMGRKTWESLPKKPLPDRVNYVITSNPDYVAEGAIVMPSLQAAIEHSQKDDQYRKINAIGGKRLLEEAALIAGRAYISRVGVKTPVDDACVMGPTLPASNVRQQYPLYEGGPEGPLVIVDVAVFPVPTQPDRLVANRRVTPR